MEKGYLLVKTIELSMRFARRLLQGIMLFTIVFVKLLTRKYYLTSCIVLKVRYDSFLNF